MGQNRWERRLVLLVAACCNVRAAAACGTRREVVDLGANDGRGIALFERLPKARTLTAVNAFEMNAGFAATLQDTLARLPGGELEQRAAWTHDRGVDADIQLPGLRGAPRRQDNATWPAWRLDNATGSSVVVGGAPLNSRSKCSRSHGAEWCSAGTRRSHVPSVDLAAWLQQRYCAADLLVVKLDIEGGEWEVLEHVLERGAARLIDHLHVEWHLRQRAPADSVERRRLEARRKRIEKQLDEAGVRMLRSWEAEPLRLALAGGNEEAATARKGGRCEGAGEWLVKCCQRHPRAGGCSTADPTKEELTTVVNFTRALAVTTV